MPMKKVKRSGNSIQLPLRINAGRSFILEHPVQAEWNAVLGAASAGLKSGE